MVTNGISMWSGNNLKEATTIRIRVYRKIVAQGHLFPRWAKQEFSMMKLNLFQHHSTHGVSLVLYLALRWKKYSNKSRTQHQASWCRQCCQSRLHYYLGLPRSSSIDKCVPTFTSLTLFASPGRADASFYTIFQSVLLKQECRIVPWPNG